MIGWINNKVAVGHFDDDRGPEAAIRVMREIERRQPILDDIVKEIEASAGSDPSFETNRKLKKDWATRLRELLK